MSKNSGLSGLVVIGSDDHDAIGAGFFAGLIKLNRVSGLIRATPGNDLGPAGSNRLTDLNQPNLFGVREGRSLAGGAGHDHAIGAV